MAFAPYTYYVYKDGANYKAKSGTTGVITYTNAAFSTIIQTIIDSIGIRDAAAFTKIKLAPGIYDVNAVITIADKYNIRIEGSGEQITEIRAGSSLGASTKMIDIFGSVSGTAKNLTANGTQKSLTVTMSTADSATFAAGDWVLLRSTADYAGGLSPGGKQGEIKQIDSINTGTGVITFTVPLFDTYNTANTANVIKLNLSQNMVISDLSINKDPSYTGTGKWFNMRFVDGFRLSNVTWIDATGQFDACCVVRSCINGRINANHLLMHDDQAYNLQYGIAIEDCSQNITVTNCTSSGEWRHPFEAGNNKETTDTEGLCRGIIFNACTGSNAQEAIFDTHAMGENIQFSNCQALGKKNSYGIQIRSAKTKVNDCIIECARNHGINLEDVASESNANECLLSNCVISNSSSSGIRIGSGIVGAMISNCLIKDNVVHGIVLDGTNDYTVIIGNRIFNNAQDGINVVNSDKLIINSNVFRNNGSYGIDFQAATCTNEIITSNQFNGNTTGTINNGGQTGNVEANNNTA